MGCSRRLQKESIVVLEDWVGPAWLPPFSTRGGTMKKQALSFIGVLSLLLVAGAAFAQSSVQSNVPFSFTVYNTTLPAGAYTISPVGISGTVLIKGAEKNSTKLVTLNSVQASESAERTKLVFHCYGRNHCFLYEVWVAGQSRGRQLPKSAAEKELTASLTSENVTVMAKAR